MALRRYDSPPWKIHPRVIENSETNIAFLFLTALFEECPADFSFLRMQDTPPAGGDTLWVSGYEM